jgi:4-amino-4-deoxy-L-arabinose transferase-like glycosyltransferase
MNKNSPWLVLLSLVWFLTLGFRSLTRPDEGRYAEIAREMLVTHQWLIPKLNAIPYFEKPPLQYWATAIFLKIFGVHPFAVRFWTGLLGFLTLPWILFVGNRLFGPERGTLAAWILLGSWYFVGLGHIGTLDMSVSFWMTVALGAFLIAQSDEKKSLWMLVAWLAAGLGFMSKGLMALALPAITLALYSFSTKQWTPWKKLRIGTGLPLFLIITLPWLVLAGLHYPSLWSFFFIHEQFDRFATTIHQRIEPVWYFAPILILGFFPWISLWIPQIRQLWQASPSKNFSPYRFLWIYSATIFIFFSLSDSKLFDYILPLFPALALIIGRQVAQRPKLPVTPILLSGLASLIIIIIGLLLKEPTWALTLGIHPDLDPDMTSSYQTLGPWIALAGLVSGTCTLISWRYQSSLKIALPILTTGLYLNSLILLTGSQALAPISGSDSWAGFLKNVPAQQPIYSVGTYDQTLDFNLNRTVILVNFEDELAYGLSLEPTLSIPSLSLFRPIWDRIPAGYAIIQPNYFQLMSQQHWAMHVLYQDTHRVIVSRR